MKKGISKIILAVLSLAIMLSALITLYYTRDVDLKYIILAIIAIALSLQTEILIMDEPSNGLDIPSKALLRRMIADNASDWPCANMEENILEIFPIVGLNKYMMINASGFHEIHLAK